MDQHPYSGHHRLLLKTTSLQSSSHHRRQLLFGANPRAFIVGKACFPYHRSGSMADPRVLVSFIGLPCCRTATFGEHPPSKAFGISPPATSMRQLQVNPTTPLAAVTYVSNSFILVKC